MRRMRFAKWPGPGSRASAPIAGAKYVLLLRAAHMNIVYVARHAERVDYTTRQAGGTS